MKEFIHFVFKTKHAGVLHKLLLVSGITISLLLFFSIDGMGIDTYSLTENGTLSIENSDNNSAQQSSIKGKITDSEGVPLPGVTVIIKGTTTGTVSSIDGDYELSASPQDVLVFSFIGMKTVEELVGEKTEINVTLESDIFGIEEVVTIGYGTQKREDLTGSIVSGDMEAVLEQPNLSLMEGLLGSVPGLNIEQTDEAGEDPDISIRGQSTLSGETDPLIVVDGVIYRGSLIDINPNDIKSVDILRDASSKAIYGSQASNGVIQIVTTGGKGEPSIKYTGRFSLQRPHHEIRAEM
ncbi:MAG: TonB-dependent receptor plug domain-containing protein, partial [Prolixibacteraceae bacterium]|nr:TonB-dependent receptor plug domain-containing protein [Prolixibacteraceae bacterium]